MKNYKTASLIANLISLCLYTFFAYTIYLHWDLETIIIIILLCIILLKTKENKHTRLLITYILIGLAYYTTLLYYGIKITIITLMLHIISILYEKDHRNLKIDLTKNYTKLTPTDKKALILASKFVWDIAKLKDFKTSGLIIDNDLYKLELTIKKDIRRIK